MTFGNNTGAPPLPFLVRPAGQPVGNAKLPSLGLFVRTTLLQAATLGTGYNGTFTVGPTTKFIRARIWGGGGGGGGAQGVTSQCSAGAGGGAGGYCEVVTNVAPNTGFAYTIGAGGAGGVPGVSAALSGTTSSLAVGAATYTANGGSGGATMNAAAANQSLQGGQGAAAGSGGTVNAPGESGDGSFTLSNVFASGGNGASTQVGGGGLGACGNAAANGVNGGGFGAGGSGAINFASGSKSGGSGTNGCIIIEEYAGAETQQTNGYVLLNVQIFNNADGQTAYTPTPGCNAVLIEMVGGGGGGGGSTGGASSRSVGAGGGSGVYIKQWINGFGVSGLGIGGISGGSVAVAAGGTGGASGGGNGGTGGLTQITVNGTTYNAFGGEGGAGMGAASAFAGAWPGPFNSGGSTGNLGTAWQSGGIGLADITSSQLNIAGQGGSSPLGSGGAVNINANFAGNPGGPGFGGGGGGSSSTTANAAGGAGSAGIIIVYEFA